MGDTRISPLQRNVLRNLDVKRVRDSSLTEFQRKPYHALQRKGLIKLTTGGHWCILGVNMKKRKSETINEMARRAGRVYIKNSVIKISEKGSVLCFLLPR